MTQRDTREPPTPADGAPPVPCEACRSALRSVGRETVSFLLVDQLTVPLVGCSDHLEAFRAACGLTTEGTADLLDHRPAGGIACPGCRLAVHDPHHPMVPVENGGVVVLACQTHQSQVIDRYQSGLDARREMTSSLDI